MTTSGTVSSTTIRVVDLLEDALKACGVQTPEMTPEIYKTAKDNLYFYLSSLANDGIQLWTIQKYIMGLIPGQLTYDLDNGAVDVLNAVYRTVTYPSGGTATSSAGGSADLAFDGDITTWCTQTSSNGNISYDFGAGSDFTPIMFGILPHGDATYNLVYEYSDDDVTYTTHYAPGSQSYTDLVWTLNDVDQSSGHRYWRVRETGGATLDLREVMFGAAPTEINIARVSNDVYANLTNKFQTGTQPLQYWVDRQVDLVKLKVWPAASECLNQIVVYRRRYIQDVGNLTNTLEVPQRWLFAVTTGLARYLCLKVPNTDINRYPILKEMADEQWLRASAEERDNSAIDLLGGVLTQYSGSR
jgi:hypothetical protein